MIENQTNWINAAALLVSSLRRNGGPYAGSPFVLLVNDWGPEGRPDWEIREEGVIVRGNTRLPALPHLSKVEALSRGTTSGYDHLILLDHDTVVLQLDDLGDYLDGVFRARRNFKHSLRSSLGATYAEPLGGTRRPWHRVAYFNSGVVIVPRAVCSELGPAWRRWGERLLVPYQGRPLSEQIGLAMAVAEIGARFHFLPMTYNETNWKVPSGQARIIHYNAHDRINKHVKKDVMVDYGLLREFLSGTDNRFWRAHARSVGTLIDDGAATLAGRLESALATLRPPAPADR